MASTSEGAGGAFERGEVWFAQHSPTEGHEQRGDRPTLIVSETAFNQGPSGLVVACPMTTRRRELRWRVPVMPPAGGLDREGYVICEGVRSMAKARFRRYLGTVSDDVMRQVEERLRFLMRL